MMPTSTQAELHSCPAVDPTARCWRSGAEKEGTVLSGTAWRRRQWAALLWSRAPSWLWVISPCVLSQPLAVSLSPLSPLSVDRVGFTFAARFGRPRTPQEGGQCRGTSQPGSLCAKLHHRPGPRSEAGRLGAEARPGGAGELHLG